MSTEFELIEIKKIARGSLYNVSVQEKEKEIFFTLHSLERIKRWQLDIESVIRTLLFPEEVVCGHRKRFIAHRIVGRHIIRAVYEYEDSLPVLITVYFPYSEKYFEGGGKYADKIFE